MLGDDIPRCCFWGRKMCEGSEVAESHPLPYADIPDIPDIRKAAQGFAPQSSPSMAGLYNQPRYFSVYLSHSPGAFTMTTIQHPGWITVPAQPLAERGLVHFYQPDVHSDAELYAQIQKGICPRLFILDDGETRRLHFCPHAELIQTLMRIDDPDALVLDYAKCMMGFLLFNPQPQHIMIIGLGGGALSKFCYRQLPQSRVATLELSGDIIACKPWFLIPEDDARFSIIQADAGEYFAQAHESADVIMLDAFEGDDMVGSLCKAEFYSNLRNHLSSGGMLVVNACGPSSYAHIQLIRECFEGNVACVDVGEDNNHIVFAFNTPDCFFDADALEEKAHVLKARLGFEFESVLQQLQKDFAARRM